MVALRAEAERVTAVEPYDLIVLPESFDGWSEPPAREDASAAAASFLTNLAKACGAHVIGGSVERPVPGERPRNTCLVFDRNGRHVGRYDKRVLFGPERERREPGEGPMVFELDGVRVGVLICGDLWRAELTLELAGRVDLLCVPAKTAVLTDVHQEYARWLWHNLALTRAMECGIAVAVSDWAAARHDEVERIEGQSVRRTYYTSGGASICDPSHRPDFARIQQLHDKGEAGTLVADIDLQALEQYRAYRRSMGLLR